MGLFDRFRAKPPSTSPPSGFDPELIARMERIGAANAQARGGVDPDTLMLVPCTNREGVITDDRPTVPFTLVPLGRGDDTWRFEGRIDGATSSLRFLIDLQVPNFEPASSEQIAAGNTPGFELTFRRSPGSEHGELARSACLLSWRAEAEPSFLSERRDDVLRSGSIALGAALVRTRVTYGWPGKGSWVLLKCDQPGPFFVGFDAASGAAEMFPRRFDEQGYAFALDLLRTVA